MQETLRTGRLILRPWADDDAEFVYDMYSRWEVQRYIGVVPRVMQDRDEARERIARWRELANNVHAIWAAEREADGQLVGTVLLKPIPASGAEPLDTPTDTEVGWHFHPDFWGNGYASEGAAAALAHGFRHGLKEIVAVTNPANAPSQRVCQRIGMQAQGLTDRYYDTTCELFIASPVYTKNQQLSAKGLPGRRQPSGSERTM